MSRTRLALLRYESELTQKQLSDLSGVSTTQISKMERGVIKLGNVSAANILSLAKSLKTSVEDLMRDYESEGE